MIFISVHSYSLRSKEPCAFRAKTIVLCFRERVQHGESIDIHASLIRIPTEVKARVIPWKSRQVITREQSPIRGGRVWSTCLNGWLVRSKTVSNDVDASLYNRAGRGALLQALEERLHLDARIQIALLDILHHDGRSGVHAISHQICDPGKAKCLLEKKDELLDVVRSCAASGMVCWSRVEWPMEENDSREVQETDYCQKSYFSVRVTAALTSVSRYEVAGRSLATDRGRTSDGEEISASTHPGCCG